MKNIIVPKQIMFVLEKIRLKGYEAFIVGGCIRDSILGNTPKDWDITTSALPQQIKEIFSGLTIIETGIRHGTVTLIIDRNPVEITTFRSESKYSDNRRPDSIQFISNISEDLSRRDFTINALAYSGRIEDGIIDLYNGVDDINNKLIRCVGNPDKRFKEDALRILRALRFASVLDFKIDKCTSESIHRHCDLLNNITPERIFSEFIKLLCGKGCTRILREYRDIIAVFIPEIKPMFGFNQNTPYHCYDVWEHTLHAIDNIEPNPELRMSMLLHDIGKPNTCSTEILSDGTRINHFYSHATESAKIAKEVLTRLKTSSSFRKNVCSLVEHHGEKIALTGKCIKRRLNTLGQDILEKLIKVKRADVLAQPEEFHSDRLDDLDQIDNILKKVISNNECFKINDLAIDGRDCIELGFSGPEIGEKLELALSAVLDEKIDNNKSEILKFILSH